MIVEVSRFNNYLPIDNYTQEQKNKIIRKKILITLGVFSSFLILSFIDPKAISKYMKKIFKSTKKQ